MTDAAPKPRRTKAGQREETLALILDAAEALFAEHGYYGVTLKDVAKKVGVSSTLMHYHFNGKESLFDAVWARGAPRSVDARLEAMRAYAAKAGDHPTVEGALRAFLDTDFDLNMASGLSGRYMGILGAQANSAPGWGADKMEYFNPTVMVLIGLLKKALPGCDEARIFWGYHFVSGALTHAMARTGRIDRLSNGLCSSEDFASIKHYMATFMAAGFEAICRLPATDPA
jgi:AcrR family transcriptional regulator